jgi:starch synthase
MVAMRYGCVPVVHAVGGLADTVSDYQPETGQGNGFRFDHYDAMALYASLVRAVETYRHAEIWRQLVRRCMLADFSWRRSAEKYIDLYFRALAVKRQAQRTLSDYALARNE